MLAIIAAIVSVYVSIYLSRPKRFEQRFAESFSRIQDQLSGDPNYIYLANKSKHGGFTTASCRNRLRGLDPSNPLLDDLDLGPLHVTLANMPMNEFTTLGRVISKFRLPPSHPLMPKRSMLVTRGKVIVVAAANPTMREMERLAEKLKALKIDSNIPITLFPNGYVNYGRNISYVGG